MQFICDIMRFKFKINIYIYNSRVKNNVVCCTILNIKYNLFFILYFFILTMSCNKREHNESDNEEDWIGPLPSEAVPQKKQKG